MISVLMPCYNAVRYVEAAVRSVQDQACPVPVELLIQDDGSTDGSTGVLQSLAAHDPMIRLEHWDNQGVSAARNRLLARLDPGSRAVTFLDADDQMVPGRLARDLAALSKAAMVYSRMQLVETTEPDMRHHHDVNSPGLRGISVSTALLTRDAVGVIGGFEPGMTHGEDLDFLLRVFELGLPVVECESVSILYRQHYSATSDRASLRRGILHALRLHARRLRANPDLRQSEGSFDFTRLLFPESGGAQTRTTLERPA